MPYRSADPRDAQRAAESRPWADVAFLFALPLEASGLIRHLTRRSACPLGVAQWRGQLRGRSVVIATSGVGRRRAARATRRLLESYQVRCVVSAGFAGALREDLQRGDIVLAETLVDASGREHLLAAPMPPSGLSQTNVHVGRLLTVDRIVATRQQRLALAARHGAIGCDMESMAVAEACQCRQVPLRSVRVISDRVGDQLHPQVVRLLDDPGPGPQWPAAVRQVLRHPAMIGHLFKLHALAGRASRQLGEFLQRCSLED